MAEDIEIKPLKNRGEMKAAKTGNKDVTIGPVATVYRPGDFVDMTLNGHDDVAEGWFRVEGPGLNDTLRCGVERPLRAQFMVQGYGKYTVTFTDGKKDLASTTLDIERDDVVREESGKAVVDEPVVSDEHEASYHVDHVVTKE